jgi:hypothetical protein
MRWRPAETKPMSAERRRLAAFSQLDNSRRKRSRCLLKDAVWRLSAN